MAASKVNSKKIQKCIETLTTAGIAVGEDHLIPNCSSEHVKKGDECMIKIDEIVPTQAAIGFEQVELRRLKVRRQIADQTLRRYLEETPEPIVIGPNRRLYIIDHHHLGAALMQEGVQRTYGIIVEDLSHLDFQNFWAVMDSCKWVYAKNEKGESIPYEQLPATLADLRDNPYRSLAGFVRKSDGFSKVPEPFIEFKWAEFFQNNLNLQPEEIQNNYEVAIQAAFELARSEAAARAGLPGYIKSGKEAQLNKATGTLQKQSSFSCKTASDAAKTRQ